MARCDVSVEQANYSFNNIHRLPLLCRYTAENRRCSLPFRCFLPRISQPQCYNAGPLLATFQQLPSHSASWQSKMSPDIAECSWEVKSPLLRDAGTITACPGFERKRVTSWSMRNTWSESHLWGAEEWSRKMSRHNGGCADVVKLQIWRDRKIILDYPSEPNGVTRVLLWRKQEVGVREGGVRCKLRAEEGPDCWKGPEARATGRL